MSLKGILVLNPVLPPITMPYFAPTWSSTPTLLPASSGLSLYQQ